MVRVSVVIPTLNEEKYIESLLFHLKKQEPYEIIVADSYSEDATRQIAKKYKVKVANAPKKNPAAGRNAGAKVAKGDVLLFLDADNVPFDNLVETVARDFKNQDLVGWTCNVFAFSPSRKEHVLYEMYNDVAKFFVKVKKPQAAGIVMGIRKKTFDELNGFCEDKKVTEDIDMTLRVGKKGKFAFSTDTCVFTSTRRINKWGASKLIKEYAKMYLNFAFKRNKEFEYPPIR